MRRTKFSTIYFSWYFKLVHKWNEIMFVFGSNKSHYWWIFTGKMFAYKNSLISSAAKISKIHRIQQKKISLRLMQQQQPLNIFKNMSTYNSGLKFILNCYFLIFNSKFKVSQLVAWNNRILIAFSLFSSLPHIIIVLWLTHTFYYKADAVVSMIAYISQKFPIEN